MHPFSSDQMIRKLSMEISVLTLGNRSARIIRGSRRVVAGRPGRLGADLTTDALTSSLLNIIYVVLYRAVVPTRLATKRPWPGVGAPGGSLGFHQDDTTIGC